MAEKPIRVIIVDDEELCRRGIHLILSETDVFEVVAECSDGKEAITQVKKLKPDIMFLDIQMPEVSGFEVLQAIAPADMPFVIFVTAYDEFAVKAFEVHALDYILKPFSKTRFMKALARARESLKDKEVKGYGESLQRILAKLNPEDQVHGSSNQLQRILIKDRDTFKFVRVEEIEWIEGADYYINIHSAGHTHLNRGSLKDIEHRLPAGSFARIHKSAIVNINKIKEIKSDFKNDLVVVLSSGKQLKVSRRRRKALLESWEREYGLKS